LVAGLLASSLACGPDEAPRPGPASGGRERPNVLYVLWDAQRARQLPAYGHSRPTTPFLDRFVDECALFERAHSQAPSTLESVVSTFTSTYPQHHGAAWRTEGNELVSVTPPPGAFVSLAETCRAAGLWTEAFVGNPWLTPGSGVEDGFERYTCLEGYENTAQLTEALLEAIDELGANPWFLYAHYIDPHSPFLPPEPYRSRFESAPYEGPIDAWDIGRLREGLLPWGPEERRFYTERYEAEVAWMDEQFRRVIGALREHGLLDDTLVILASDHGEELGEHGGWEHDTLFQECLEIPLLVRFPRGEHAGRHAMLVETVDLYPTVAEFLGVDVPEHVLGRSLQSQIGGRWRRELSYARHPPRGVQSFLFDDGTKLILPLSAPADANPGERPRLFDLESDPGETENLAARQVERMEASLRRAAEWLEATERELPDGLVERSHTGEALQTLRELGYLGGQAMAEPEDG
jgi:arylsulfatase A-like enzyme